MHTDCDIGVVGGGLSGLCLALLAADAGFSVVLFEKEQYPFHKVCGEYISFESYNFLMLLGLPLYDWNLPEIKKLELSDVQGRLYNFPLDLGGFGISRYMIDNALYELARQRGVVCLANEKVNDINFESNHHLIQTNKRSVKVKIAAGAFGKRSNLDVKWKRKFTQKKTNKLNNYVGVKYHVRTKFPKDTIALHNFKNGYCGISAIEEDKYCLCYLTNAENLSVNNNSIKKMEENVLHKNPVLREIFSRADFLYEAPLSISQVSFNKKTQVEDHVLILGDAAGMITPLCGNGMSMAMHSAKLAFNEINDFLQHKISRNDMELNYTISWKKKFAKRLTAGRIIQRFTGNDISTAFFLKLMNSSPLLAKSVIKSTHGKAF